METKYFDCEFCGCKAELNNDNTVIEVINGMNYLFCCKECREAFMVVNHYNAN